MTITEIRLKNVLLIITLFFSLVGSMGASEAHILIIGDSKNDLSVAYQETSQLAADLRARGYPVLDLYRNDATTENILKGMYGADAVIYAGHGGYQTGHYNMAGGTASPPFALTGSNDFIWGIGEQMREGWSGDLFTAPFKEDIPVFLLHACFSTGWVENFQVANPTETIYNFAQMFTGAGANYYATAWNGADIIYDFLNGATNFQEANTQNNGEVITKSNLYNGVQVWRNNNGYAAFVGDWNGAFPSVAQTTAYDESAADAWYHGDRQLINNFYVDATNGNDSWDGTSATYMGGTKGPMKTITSTLNALTFFGTINVASGTYNENIIIDKKINLLGSGISTIITPSNAQNPIITINTGGSGTTVRGFFLNGASTSSAIAISGASSCTISSNEISGNSNGVYCEGGNNNNIKENTITQGSSGVTIKNSENVKIEDNKITSNTGTGVTVNGSNSTTIQRNNISNNQNGVAIIDDSQGNVVTDNNINDNQDSGVEIRQSQNNRISHNNIKNNVQTGIKLNKSTGNIINNGNTINGSNIGIDLQNNSNSNTINGNFISANNRLIRSSASSDNTITNNQFTFDASLITNAATEVVIFTEKNNRLPNSVVISGVTISMPSFLELLTTVTLKIYNNDHTPVDLTENYKNAVAPKDSQKMGSLSLLKYVEIAGRVNSYMDRYLIAPNYSSYSNLGTYFGYQNMIYTYSKILDTYNDTGALPDSILVRSWTEIISLPNPSSTVKLTFIHHSCGSNWLANGNGNLGADLNANNYYVTDTNYGWDAEVDDNLGDHTNTNDWYLWFNDVKMPYVYNNNAQTVYTNTITNPGGENEIIMFKSCYPLSEVGSSINDEKTLYNNLKAYFAAHPDKMFILVTPPGETTVSSYQLTRDLCNWLVDTENGWLSDYTGDNVYVFDLYCVLSEVNSHHRWYNGQIQHVYASDYDGVSPYHNGDDHPNSTGNRKATTEFITFLNYAYNQWKN